MSLYCAGQDVSHNSQCADSTIKNLRNWFKKFIQENYKGMLTTTEDLRDEDDCMTFITEYNQIFANFEDLRKFFKKLFPHFERVNFVKLYNLEGNLSQILTTTFKNQILTKKCKTKMIEFCIMIFSDILLESNSWGKETTPIILKNYFGHLSRILSNTCHMDLSFSNNLKKEILEYTRKNIQSKAQAISEESVHQELLFIEQIYLFTLGHISKIFEEQKLFADQVKGFKNIFNKGVWVTFISRLSNQKKFLQDSFNNNNTSFYQVIGGLSQEIGYDYSEFAKIIYEELKIFGEGILNSKELQQKCEKAENKIIEENMGILQEDLHVIYETKLIAEFVRFIKFVNQIIFKLCQNHKTMRKTKIKLFEHIMNYKSKYSHLLDKGLYESVKNAYFYVENIFKEKTILPDPESKFQI
jgi:hypothetical protein